VVAGPAEVAAMRRAVVLGARGEPSAKPNPSVGCVVLDAAGTTAGEGWHAAAGGPHAEVVALRDAGERARGGTVVVTLEPCAHTGRTGPCTEALAAAGVARVVYAVADPTAGAGDGAAALRAAGVDVEGGVDAEEAARANARWLTSVTAGRPYTTWKYAASLDGRVAAADGTSRWVSGAESRAEVHRMRAAHDCVVAGVGTVLADDPHLTAREPDGALAARQPLRVVVDTHGRTPTHARVRDDAAPTWVATADELGRGTDGRVDPRALMRGLHARGCQDAFVEGGPTLAGGLLAAGLVDRVVAYVAPVLLGDGPAALHAAGVTTLAGAHRLDVVEVVRVGEDVRLVATPRGHDAPGARADGVAPATAGAEGEG
jgi:diaminohydroxyphosphoribosylaminopyrimidine deaminase / 5-amino-6-(5-phosphoribosylamino)uracil reductase